MGGQRGSKGGVEPLMVAQDGPGAQAHLAVVEDQGVVEGVAAKGIGVVEGAGYGAACPVDHVGCHDLVLETAAYHVAGVTHAAAYAAYRWVEGVVVVAEDVVDDPAGVLQQEFLEGVEWFGLMALIPAGSGLLRCGVGFGCDWGKFLGDDGANGAVVEAELLELRDDIAVGLGKGTADVSLEVGEVGVTLDGVIGLGRYVDDVFQRG